MDVSMCGLVDSGKLIGLRSWSEWELHGSGNWKRECWYGNGRNRNSELTYLTQVVGGTKFNNKKCSKYAEHLKITAGV